MKILAVDDSPTMLEILVTTLGEAGHNVLEAGNGAEAMKVLAAEAVDMIISDLNMVVMSGFELLYKVREHPVHLGIPFVFLTTEYDEELKQAAASGTRAASCCIAKVLSPTSTRFTNACSNAPINWRKQRSRRLMCWSHCATLNCWR